MYEGDIDEKGVLVCQPEAESIIEIKCHQCGKKYQLKDFNEIEY